MAERSLNDFVRPSVAVDVAVLVVESGRLAMLVWRRDGATHEGQWALPGSFLRERERLAAAVERTLLDKCGLSGLAPTQLVVLDDPDRDERGWVLSIAHLDVIRAGTLDDREPVGEVQLVPVREGADGSSRRPVLDLPDRQRRLPFDHETIARLAIGALRRRYRDEPDPYRLLPGEFTIRQLRELHEAVLGVPLQKDTFRRSMLPGLVEVDRTAAGVVGRPAQLYRRRSQLPPT